jgi:GAF domain-containing protein
MDVRYGVREGALLDAVAELADALVSDYEIVDFLYLLCSHAMRLLDLAAAGVLLTDPGGELRLVAASTERMRMLELFEMQNREGPCLDAYEVGEQIVVPDLGAMVDRWPRFVPRALEDGLHAVYAVPLRLRAERIGAMNLFRTQIGQQDEADVAVAQVLADVASISILQERRLTAAETRAEQLQDALDSRIVIEQAKGMLAERHGVTPQRAFEALRRIARDNNLHLREVAKRAVEEGGIPSPP